MREEMHFSFAYEYFGVVYPIKLSILCINVYVQLRN